MHQYQFSLVFFTVLTQWAIGSVLAITLYRALAGKGSLPVSQKAAVVLWLICGLGSMASLAHLGTPLQAYNALRGLGHSWLSKEVVSFGAINGLMTLWMLTHVVKGRESLQQPLGALIGLFGLVAIAMSGHIYYVVEHQPGWHTVLTHLAFVGSALLLGLATLMVVVRQSGNAVPASLRYLQGASVLLVLAIITQLSLINCMDSKAVLNGYRIFASIIAGSCLFIMTKNLTSWSPAAVTASILLMVSGEMAGRMAFYSSALGQMPW